MRRFALVSVLALAACGRVSYASHDLVGGVAMGNDHACVLSAGGLRCAGSNTLGQLGRGDASASLSFVAVALGEASTGVEVSAAYGATAVRDVRGAVWTFGAGDRGQLGRAVSGPAVGLVALPGPSTRVSLRFEHGCAIVEEALFCWGSNAEGELGQDDPVGSADRSSPVRVAPSMAFADVSCGQGHTCAVTTSGALLCWGRNTEGELGLGDGVPGQLRAPTEVSGRWSSVAAGQSHTCAIRDDGDLYCWGDDFDADGHAGPLGLEGTAVHTLPTLVDGGGDWVALSTDTFHTCGVRADGSLWCWGRNAEGQGGLGDRTARADAPRRVGSEHVWAEVAVGRFTTCARTRDGRLFCAGDNRDGQLGLGDRDLRDRFTQVQLP